MRTYRRFVENLVKSPRHRSGIRHPCPLQGPARRLTMPITRTARIARTAHDKTHLNRLGVPEFGVVEIQMKGQGGSLSKCYRDASSTTPTAPATTGVDTFHFAPGPQYSAATWTADPALKDDVKIVYKLHNPQFAIAEAKIEIFTRFATDRCGPGS